jgi:hypothetical protein
MAKLTKAQMRFLRDARGSGGIPPDVLVGGERPMADRLQAAGRVELLNAHPVTGRMHQAFHLTESGRHALTEGDQHGDR